MQGPHDASPPAAPSILGLLGATLFYRLSWACPYSSSLHTPPRMLLTVQPAFSLASAAVSMYCRCLPCVVYFQAWVHRRGTSPGARQASKECPLKTRLKRPSPHLAPTAPRGSRPGFHTQCQPESLHFCSSVWWTVSSPTWLQGWKSRRSACDSSSSLICSTHGARG